MNKIHRRTAFFGLLAALLGPSIFGARDANATTVTVYDQNGTRVVVDTSTLTGPVHYYTATGAPYMVYPVAPVFVPAPIYGPLGVRGQSRRVSRRTSRRVSRRR